jgi:O-antigen ligase/polysaccharide polymerase Wzy-like membrane protein
MRTLRTRQIASATRSRTAEPALAVLLGCLGFAAVARGAFFQRPLRMVEVGVVLAAALTVAMRRRGSLVPVGAAAAVAGWLVLSGAVNHTSSVALEEAVFVLVLGVAAWVTSALAPDSRALLQVGVVLAGTVVAGTSAVGLAAHLRPWALPLADTWRGSSTITYANATACLALIAAAVAVASTGADRAPGLARQAAVAVCLLGVATTVSRGAVPAAVAGVVALVACGKGRQLRAYCLAAAAALIALIGFLPSFALDVPPRPLLAAATTAVGGALLALRPRRVTPVLVALGTAGLLAAALVGHAGVDLVHRVANGPSVTGRGTAWSAYLAAGTRHLLVGTGPRSFAVHLRGRGTAAALAHNEYLQLFAEAGAVGLALAVAGVAALTRAVAGPDRAGALAVVTIAGVYALTDFVWNVPVIPLVAAVAVGIALRPARSA